MRDATSAAWLALVLGMACSEAAPSGGLADGSGLADGRNDPGDGDDAPGDGSDEPADGSATQPDAAVGDAGQLNRDADGGGAGDGSDGSIPGVDAGVDAGPLTWGGFPARDHCTPGNYNRIGARACNDTQEGIEAALASGIDPDSGYKLGVNWKTLTVPMTPGQPYAMSTELTLFEPEQDAWQFEVWGVMSPCAMAGEQADLLDVVPMDRGSAVYCAELQPTKAYSHVLLVHRQIVAGEDIRGYSYYGQTYCPAGSCPAP